MMEEAEKLLPYLDSCKLWIPVLTGDLFLVPECNGPIDKLKLLVGSFVSESRSRLPPLFIKCAYFVCHMRTFFHRKSLMRLLNSCSQSS